MRKLEKKLPPLLVRLLKDPKRYCKPLGEAPFSLAELEDVASRIIQAHQKKPNYIPLDANFRDILFVGDTHANVDVTVRIVRHFLEKKVGSMVFLGDYVDRGEHSMVNFLYVLALSLAWPNSVIVLRGNHEDLEINGHYGFLDEIEANYPTRADSMRIKEIMKAFYDHLSLAVKTPQGSIGLHGGVPMGLDNLERLNDIPKPHSDLLDTEFQTSTGHELSRIFTQLLWNDPRENPKHQFRSSMRGPGIFLFNEEALTHFLEENEAARLVRAHESSRGGFQQLFGGKLLHVFSTEPYFGQVPKGSLIHEQADGKTWVRDLDWNPLQEIEWAISDQLAESPGVVGN